ncbi:MAG TPA: mechanosensitive ion channel family protein [Acidimicrobiales bacterium]|nr:mechanosensitive ion channel family protein [Acidimicrobiales bacterium]
MNEHGYLYDLLRKLGLSDFGASTGEVVLVRPFRVFLLILAGLVIGRLAARTARRFVKTLHSRSPVRSGSLRAEQRMGTVGNVLAGMARVAIAVVVALLVLGEIGVNLAPLLAGAGIAGVAIGFGAQSLVKDFLSGLFILLEDQYGVGDVINLGEVTGTVEDLTLRVTRLRSTDGTVWFIPNSEIKQVGNSSMEWSRALIDVLVAYDNDVALVTRSLKEVAAAFSEEETWREFVLEPPEVWGVQAMGADGVTIRLVVKTAPRQQYAVARELRGRITDRLRREGVRGPGQTVVVSTSSDAGSPPPPALPPEGAAPAEVDESSGL